MGFLRFGCSSTEPEMVVSVECMVSIPTFFRFRFVFRPTPFFAVSHSFLALPSSNIVSHFLHPFFACIALSNPCSFFFILRSRNADQIFF